MKRSSAYPVAVALLVGVTLFVSCSAPEPGTTADAKRPPPPPKPTLNHALHLSNGLDCATCHDPDGTGTPHLPSSETCFMCHNQDLSKEPPRVQAYFAKAKQPDGTYKFKKTIYESDVSQPHARHAKAGVECATCHGQPSEKAFVAPPPFQWMQTCLDCHSQRNVPTTCETCHKTIRKDVMPPSHHDPMWRKVHGKSAPQDWKQGGPSRCATCHEVPQDCITCHKTTKPSSHLEAGWHYLHGKGYTDATDEPFKETSCSNCHEQQMCILCHRREKPRSHTPAFIRRLHGIVASIDQQSCATCHKEDTCIRCHQTTEPLSHRGNWAAPQQAHCLVCHEPLNDNSCFVCHKNTRGHLQAPALPLNATHAGASSPSDCLDCHTVLPHLDNGESCRRCHR